MRLVLQAPGGAPSRPLVVRRAVTHKPAGGGVQVPQQRSWLGDPFGAVLPEHTSLTPVAPMQRGALDGGGVMQVQMLQGGYLPAYVAAPQLPASYGLPPPQQLWQQGAPQLGYAGGEHQQQHGAVLMPPGVMAMPAAMFPQAAHYALVAEHSPRVQEGLGPASGLQQAYGQLAMPHCSMPLSAGLSFAPDNSPQQLNGSSQQQLSSSMLTAAAAAASVAASAPPAVHAGSYLLSGPASAAAGSPPLVAQQVQHAAAAPGGYQQPGGGAMQQQQEHTVSIPITPVQISSLHLQLSGVSAMSGATIRAEHNLACGSLALVISAASQQQLAVAWQLVQGMLAAQGASGTGQQTEVMGQA
jgi:hypothetical protein